jgi:hypothetical protein
MQHGDEPLIGDGVYISDLMGNDNLWEAVKIMALYYKI